MLHQMVHLKRLFVKDRDQMEDMEGLSFIDLNRQIYKLINGSSSSSSSSSSTLYSRISDKVDRLMVVKVPVLSGL